jgi:hypothetical protein
VADAERGFNMMSSKKEEEIRGNLKEEIRKICIRISLQSGMINESLKTYNDLLVAIMAAVRLRMIS